MIRDFEGKSPRLGEGAWVDASAQVIGDVTLGADSSVWPLVTIRGDVNAIRIGARSVVAGLLLCGLRSSKASRVFFSWPQKKRGQPPAS